MSIFKPFLTTDTVQSPFEVNKSFTFQGVDGYGYVNYGTTALYGGLPNPLNNPGISIYIGKNTTPNPWHPDLNTGYTPYTQNEYLVYKSIQHLYYSNFLTNPSGSIASTASFDSTEFVPDMQTAINLNTLTGPISTTNNYNYLTTTLPPKRIFPTNSGARIGVLSIPSKIYGEHIKLGSFSLSNIWGTITDDYDGNLTFSSSLYNVNNFHVGNIIYEHGMAVINSELFGIIDGYGSSSYGTSSLYPVALYGGLFDSFFDSNVITCSFKSTTTIYELQYKCTIRENEFNFSQNLSLISGSTWVSGSNGCITNGNGVIYDFATGSYFAPYVTTVGLYNNNKELIAIAKLSQPLPTSAVTDTTILVNLDL
jgi:hypothetical protein